MHPVSTIDRKAREKSLEILREKFGVLAKEIVEGRKPVLILPKRVLTNTIYDIRRKLLLLGPEMQRRSLLDVNEARKFMQTLLMASIIYEALVNNEYPTIRDLYYRGKHTITYRDPKGRLHHENTWDEQRESDSVIRDIEVFLGLLREEMLILSKEKGKVVGNLVIRSGDDTIDLSKMGHGAYSIEPTPDLIEFKDVDADFVLVVEKDAVFQQLHRYGFWKKYRSILVTSAGQPDRATRRFIRRLNDELKLPIYILTDSIPGDEVVIVRDRVNGKIHVGPIEELIGDYFDPNKERERIEIPIDVPSWNPETGGIEWRPIGYAYRHRINGEILGIETNERGTIRVTKAHSLFIFRNGEIQVIPAKEIKPGDYILAAERLPKPASGETPAAIQVKDATATLTGLKRIPDEIINSPRDIMVSYLKGLIDDEDIDRYGDIVLPTRDPVLSKQLVNLLLMIGVQPSATINGENIVIRIGKPSLSTPHVDEHEPETGPTHEIPVSGELRRMLIRLSDNILESFKPTQKTISKFELERIKELGVNLPSGYESLVKSDVTLVRVEDVRPVRYEGYVYDFAVPQTNSFIGSYGIVLHNSDPYGWYIYSVFKIGSITLSYESERLATPQVKFLGVSMTDVFGDERIRKHVRKLRDVLGPEASKLLRKMPKKPYLSEKERRNYIIKAKAKDVERAIELVGYDIAYKLISNPEIKAKIRGKEGIAGYPWFRTTDWIREISIFFDTLAKLEIEAMASKGLKFLADQYIPSKIETGDWID